MNFNYQIEYIFLLFNLLVPRLFIKFIYTSSSNENSAFFGGPYQSTPLSFDNVWMLFDLFNWAADYQTVCVPLRAMEKLLHEALGEIDHKTILYEGSIEGNSSDTPIFFSK